MSMYVSAHMTTYAKKEDKRFPNLVVELSYCEHKGDSASKWNPEANTYTRMKVKSYDENVDITFYVQPEHLMALHAALGEYLENLPGYVERGERESGREDVIKRSEDFAPKPEPEVDQTQEEKERLEALQAAEN